MNAKQRDSNAAACQCLATTETEQCAEQGDLQHEQTVVYGGRDTQRGYPAARQLVTVGREDQASPAANEPSRNNELGEMVIDLSDAVQQTRHGANAMHSAAKAVAGGK